MCLLTKHAICEEEDNTGAYKAADQNGKDDTSNHLELGKTPDVREDTEAHINTNTTKATHNSQLTIV